MTKIDGNDETNFAVTFECEKETKTVRARKIVLATGLQDIIPSTPGLQEIWGKGLYWYAETPSFSFLGD